MLDGKTALVCGASQGIGRAIAKELALMGCRIIAVSRSEEKLQNLVEQELGPNHHYWALDLKDRDHLKQVVQNWKDPIHIILTKK